MSRSNQLDGTRVCIARLLRGRTPACSQAESTHSAEEADDMTCAICLDRTQLVDIALVKGCEHQYCGECLGILDGYPHQLRKRLQHQPLNGTREQRSTLELSCPAVVVSLTVCTPACCMQPAVQGSCIPFWSSCCAFCQAVDLLTCLGAT